MTLSEPLIFKQERGDRIHTYTISIAPMMDRTDRHYRYFMRQITQRTLLYTEMVTSAAIKHGDKDYLLSFSPEENPLALQVGGDNPQDLAECARIAEAMGYNEINLNVGCPSDRVQSGNFGACLMKTPALVAKCIEAANAVFDETKNGYASEINGFGFCFETADRIEGTKAFLEKRKPIFLGK